MKMKLSALLPFVTAAWRVAAFTKGINQVILTFLLFLLTFIFIHVNAVALGEQSSEKNPSPQPLCEAYIPHTLLIPVRTLAVFFYSRLGGGIQRERHDQYFCRYVWDILRSPVCF